MKIPSLPPLLPLLCLALALFCAGCGSNPNEGATAAANRFAQMLMAEDYGSAYREASMKFRTQTRFGDFSFQAARLKAAPESSVTWSQPVEEDDQIRLTGTVPRAEGDPAQIELTLTREIDQWRVSQFDVE